MTDSDSNSNGFRVSRRPELHPAQNAPDRKYCKKCQTKRLGRQNKTDLCQSCGRKGIK